MATIYSKKFILRPFKKGDEDSLIRNINNRKIVDRTILISYPYKREDALFWINHNLKLDKAKKKTQINFAIDIGGDVVGGIGLNIKKGYKASIGYWLGEKYWGQGIMTTAVKLITKYGFTKLGLRRIYGCVFLFNKASARVLEKAGYKFEGKLRNNTKKGNKLIDDLMFAKVK